MRESYIRKLVGIVRDSTIYSLEVKSWWDTIEIVNKFPKTRKPEKKVIEKRPIPIRRKIRARHAHIYARYDGRFYWKDPVREEPFLEVGQEISRYDVLAHIQTESGVEEVVAPYGGIVREILVENSKYVENSTPLFLVEVKD